MNSSQRSSRASGKSTARRHCSTLGAPPRDLSKLPVRRTVHKSVGPNNNLPRLKGGPTRATAVSTERPIKAHRENRSEEFINKFQALCNGDKIYLLGVNVGYKFHSKKYMLVEGTPFTNPRTGELNVVCVGPICAGWVRLTLSPQDMSLHEVGGAVWDSEEIIPPSFGYQVYQYLWPWL